MNQVRSRRMLLFPVLPLRAIAINITNGVIAPDPSMITLPSPFEIPANKWIIIGGSYNGIVLLVVDKDMILYNPFTTTFKIIPPSPYIGSYNMGVYGFGYGIAPYDDLKIFSLRAKDTHTHYIKQRSIFCDFFSLKDGLWSTISSELPLTWDYNIFCQAGTFLNGFLYWKATKGHDPYSNIILALDIKHMKFSEIQFPYSFKVSLLGTLNGRLCAFSVAQCWLWIMNEHGFGKSWSRVCSSLSLLTGDDYQSSPMCIFDEGKIAMFKKPNKLVIHDLLKDSYIGVYEMNALEEIGYGYPPIEYVESLISPSNLCSNLVELFSQGMKL